MMSENLHRQEPVRLVAQARLTLDGVRAMLALAAIGGTLLALWAGAFAAGGSHTELTHLFYFPIVLAAVRFGVSGAATTALGAGLLAGPFLPEDVAAGEPQPLLAWVLQLVIFTGIGVFMALLAEQRSGSLRSAFHDSRLSRALLRALRRGDVSVHYQPIRRTTDGRIVALEALARWTDPRRGEIAPDVFIPVAERTGAVSEVDRYVLRKAAEQVAQWTAEHGQVIAAVNVSATWFAEADLFAEVEDVLLRTGLPAAQLELEITETALISDIRRATEQIDRLRAIGVHVAIDDFGVGQASLSYVNDFDVTTVKIDGSFVSKALVDSRTALLLTGLISLFGTLGLRVVAEGVSNEAEYARLRTLGCENVQGYHLGRPAPADITEGLLQEAGITPMHG
jgi:EAL domain-containing protein (putative c-di-GMP-specific phosphodiesterase class I)